MKKKYAHHPMDFAIGENEKFYADMAARGWLLDKRGGYFSRFVEGKPQALRYRIELSQPLFLDETRAAAYLFGSGRERCPGILQRSPAAGCHT